MLLANDTKGKPFFINTATAETKAPMKLNLGCHRERLEGYVNVDIMPYPGVDELVDLEKQWPWPDESVSEIVCTDLVEHLRQVYEYPDPKGIEMAMEHAEKNEMKEAFVALLFSVTQPIRKYGIIHLMDEAYRVLTPNGTLEIDVPTSDGRGAFMDPTHTSYWNLFTLDYFTVGSEIYKQYKSNTKSIWKPLSINEDYRGRSKIPYLHCILVKL